MLLKVIWEVLVCPRECIGSETVEKEIEEAPANPGLAGGGHLTNVFVNVSINVLQSIVYVLSVLFAVHCRLYDTVGGVEPLQIPLEHISYWGVHSDNKR